MVVSGCSVSQLLLKRLNFLLERFIGRSSSLQISLHFLQFSVFLLGGFRSDRRLGFLEFRLNRLQLSSHLRLSSRTFFQLGRVVLFNFCDRGFSLGGLGFQLFFKQLSRLVKRFVRLLQLLDFGNQLLLFGLGSAVRLSNFG